MFDSDRLMLNVISKVRDDLIRLYPNDNGCYSKITDILHSIAWKIKEKEENASTKKASCPRIS